jgi:hypothetical protein
MKKLFIGFTLLASVSSFAVEVCEISKITHATIALCTDNDQANKLRNLKEDIRIIRKIDIIKALLDDGYEVENPQTPRLYIKR